jgi:hypothetical protein
MTVARSTMTIPEELVRTAVPVPIPAAMQIHFRYNPKNDVLTIMVGSQDRWAVRAVDGGRAIAYVDADNVPIWIDHSRASEAFSRPWLLLQRWHVGRRAR